MTPEPQHGFGVFFFLFFFVRGGTREFIGVSAVLWWEKRGEMRGGSWWEMWCGWSLRTTILNGGFFPLFLKFILGGDEADEGWGCFWDFSRVGED
jgi:hypothetical protein